MKHGSLFSGIGGFDLASEWMGWENIFHCEWNEFGQKILKYYWPKAISYGDITKTDFSVHRGNIDILTGGFPCQPYSSAGKRLGKEDDRHLWPEMLRAIQEIQPTWIVGENVRGLVNWNKGMVFDEVQAEMEDEGYEVTPFLLPACAVNAPHRRDRIWFVAHSNHTRTYERMRDNENREKKTEKCKRKSGIEFRESCEFASNPKSQRSERPEFKEQPKTGQQKQKQPRRIDSENVIANTRLFGQEKRKEQTEGIEQCDKRNASNTNSGRQSGQEYRKEKSGRFAETGFSNYWENFPTQSPVCDGDDGLSSRLDGITFPKWRNESIKAGGNAIVPQVAYQIFKAIEKYESL